MEIKELQSLNTEALQKLLAEKRAEMRELRFKVSMDEHKKVRELRVIKKDIARILTLLNKSAFAEATADKE